MIDTKQKRSGVFELPGLMTNPFPRGIIDAPDRQQISDIYPGILAFHPIVQPSETCWKPSARNTSNWTKSSSNTSSWKPSGRNTSIWVPEKEVVPCRD